MDNAIVAEINHQNSNNQLNISRKNQCANLPKCTNLSNYLTITNGHDFVKIFAKMCPRGTSIDTITGILRGTFGQEEFKQTELYASLKKYQTTKNVRIVYYVSYLKGAVLKFESSRVLHSIAYSTRKINIIHISDEVAPKSATSFLVLTFVFNF